jgi:hypothetical protein
MAEDVNKANDEAVAVYEKENSAYIKRIVTGTALTCLIVGFTIGFLARK